MAALVFILPAARVRIPESFLTPLSLTRRVQSIRDQDIHILWGHPKSATATLPSSLTSSLCLPFPRCLYPTHQHPRSPSRGVRIILYKYKKGHCVSLFETLQWPPRHSEHCPKSFQCPRSAPASSPAVLPTSFPPTHPLHSASATRASLLTLKTPNKGPQTPPPHSHLADLLI